MSQVVQKSVPRCARCRACLPGWMYRATREQFGRGLCLAHMPGMGKRVVQRESPVATVGEKRRAEAPRLLRERFDL